MQTFENKYTAMKKAIEHSGNTTDHLDIRFITIDSGNPMMLHENFSEEHKEKTTEDIYKAIGHLSHDISKSGGYINVYTYGNAVVGEPQYVNFTTRTWDKINTASHCPGGCQHELLHELHQPDYLDHDNYNDI